jgi:tryptophan-rich sensory protein
MVLRLLIFLLLNFGALALGGLFAANGAGSSWYTGLKLAPWSPPGWMFGFAWTTIMICFSFYMSWLWPEAINQKSVIALYTLQWILNVTWNPVFFYWHLPVYGFIIIILLTGLIGYFLFHFWHNLGWKSVFILPYFLWLIIASSLNGYICLYN